VISRGSILKYFLVLVLVLPVFCVNAQQIVEADTIMAVQPLAEQEEEEIHSPRKATIYSAVLPGLGQVYNKKYWKVPLIYIGFGAIGYFINWNNENYQLFRIGYDHLTDQNPETQDYLKIEAVRRNNYNLDNPTEFNNLKTALSRQQDYYRRNRDLLIISLLVFTG
jgi:hypothetical protein